MKVSKIKCPYFNHTKSFTVSDNHIILYSGTRAVVLNKSFELICEIKDLKFVYNGSISPDGKRLLLLAEGSYFYVVSLEDYSLTKINLKRKYFGDINGIGCWSSDSRYVFIQSLDEYCFSRILKYDVLDNYSFDVMSVTDKQVRHISYVKDMEKYLIVYMNMFDHLWRFMWTDFNESESFLLKDFNDMIASIQVDEDSHTVNVNGFANSYNYDFEGNLNPIIEIPLDTFTLNFSDAFKNISVDKDFISQLCDFLGLEGVPISEGIDWLSFSKDKDMIFVGTMLKLLILDAKSLKVLKKINYEFGVRSVCELEDNLLMVETFSGVKLLKLER